ncbi:hypothetical protein ACSNOK_34445, partial [Streptomyces sp. URMC 126]|uniref:hypothetical protein n=1 Tax=Streptomyces sp. URMC 126 TaxID=3423401 RepID=UPI003F1D3B70
MRDTPIVDSGTPWAYNSSGSTKTPSGRRNAVCEKCGWGTGTTTSDERAVHVPADGLPEEGAMLA